MDWQDIAERYAVSQVQHFNGILHLTKDEKALMRQLLVRAYIEGATAAMLRAQGIVSEA